jgi:hypothetical protein
VLEEYEHEHTGHSFDSAMQKTQMLIFKQNQQFVGTQIESYLVC